MRKRVYVILANFFPTPDSWRCAYGYDYARAIERTGRYKVVVFKPGYDGDYEYNGIRVYGFKIRHVTDSGALYYFKFRENQRLFLNKFEEIGLNVGDVAVCEAYNADLGYFSWVLKKRNPTIVSVLHHHSLGSFGIMFGSHQENFLIKAMNYLWMRYVHEHQDLHVFISKKCEESFRRFPDTSWTLFDRYRNIGRGLRWFRKPRIKDSYVLHNGVDCRIFTNEQRKTSSVFRIGCVANFQQIKGHLILLRALCLIRDQIGEWNLRFVGSGPTLSECQKFVEDEKLVSNVAFMEEVDHSVLPDFFRNLDLFVMPSYFEGFGCVYTESWACGTPFIACQGMGTDDLFDNPNESNWLVNPNDEQDLAKKILRYYHVRDSQKLSKPVDIDILVPQFLDYVGGKIQTGAK